MRVACLSDIHANAPALEACLDHARDRGAERFLVAGDLVGKGPFPGDVLDRLAQLDAATVRGNVDRRVLTVDPDLEAGMPRWTAAQLSDEQIGYLETLPAEMELELAGQRLLLVHGSPVHDTDFIFPSITPQGLASKLGGREPDVLICGHSHLPFERAIGEVHVVNAGTVGLPYDGDPRPSYGMLDLEPSSVDATVHRFEYDVEAVVERIEAEGTPGAPVRLYRTGTLLGIGEPEAPTLDRP